MKAIQLVITLLMILVNLFGITHNVQAQEQAGCPTDPAPKIKSSDYVRQVISISDAISETKAPRAKEVFYQRRINIILTANDRVILSSTPDGGGPLCVDDSIEIKVMPSNQTQQLDFSNPAHTLIQSRPSLDISWMMVQGDNLVSLSFLDATPPAASASPFFLVIMAMSPPPPEELGIENLAAADYKLPTAPPLLPLTPLVAPIILSATIQAVHPTPPTCVLRNADNPSERLLELVGQNFAKPDHNVNLQFRRTDTGEESIHFHNEIYWDTDTRITLDMASIKEMLWFTIQVPLRVRLTTYQDGAFVPISEWSSPFVLAEDAAACVPHDEIPVDVYVLNFNPLIDGQPLNQYMSWNAPGTLMPDYIAEVQKVSGNMVKYHIVRQSDISAYPPKSDGFVFTNEQYQACWSNPDSATNCRQLIDYRAVLNTHYDPDYMSACEAIAAGEVDEIWLWGGPLFEYLEWNLVEPNTLCDHTSQRFFVMGFNYERRVPEMLHDLGHRAEAILRDELGPELWDQFDGQRQRYAVQEKCSGSPDVNFPEVDPNHMHCGNVHFPPNAVCPYQYDRNVIVQSDCDDWSNYPHLTGRQTTVTADTWKHDPRGFFKWWLGHLPRQPGSTHGLYNNWWNYIFLVPQPTDTPNITLTTNLTQTVVISGEPPTLDPIPVVTNLWSFLQSPVEIPLPRLSFLSLAVLVLIAVGFLGWMSQRISPPSSIGCL
jgi:hypothetical protein